uniref:Putative secreted protein n=1 Tax=Anopheles darlingi TaxID=43151 RepID=A0A2M4D673_ANODA
MPRKRLTDRGTLVCLVCLIRLEFYDVARSHFQDKHFNKFLPLLSHFSIFCKKQNKTKQNKTNETEQKFSAKQTNQPASQQH